MLFGSLIDLDGFISLFEILPQLFVVFGPFFLVRDSSVC